LIIDRSAGGGVQEQAGLDEQRKEHSREEAGGEQQGLPVPPTLLSEENVCGNKILKQNTSLFFDEKDQKIIFDKMEQR
jgi:hypothetical protein